MVSLIKTPASSRTYYIHADWRNTPRQVDDSNGTPRWARDPDPFGNAAAVTNPPPGYGGYSTFARFPGQYWDDESRLLDNYQRTYDPTLGRYLESDPIGLFGGINPYAYALANPLMYVDPYGMWAVGDPLPQGFVDFSAGFGDVLTFGLTAQGRNVLGIESVDQCSDKYGYGEIAGIAGSIATGYLAGTKAVARASSLNDWQNFSHSLFPSRYLKKFDNAFARWLNQNGNRLNGDHIPPELHDLVDSVANRVGKTLREAANNRPFSPLRRQLNRIPYTPGAAAYGIGSAELNSRECKQ